METNRFELDPSMGVLPSESEEGSFHNRPTRLIACPCGCGQPFALFADGDEEEASIQTYALRAQAADVPIEVYMSALAEALLESAMFEMSIEAMMADVLGEIAELVSEQTGAAGVLVGIGPDGLVIGTLSVAEADESGEVDDVDKDWLDWLKNDDVIQ